MTDAATPRENPRTLIDELLDEQQALTAVERFARWQDDNAAAEPSYRRLLPTAAPSAGQQYAFEVDLDKCSGCKACVTACHSLNGLDDDETWREVGLLISGDWRQPFQQTITTACHHCADPGCADGCPVLAYDKDPLTGIVRHLDDQCIGCRYCLMKCPYEVPKYSSARGIVRKCDMCHSRLAVGEAPACVQACPTEAIRITLVETRVIASQFRNTNPTPFLPSAPNPAITLPTTRYVSRRPLPATLLAGDQARIAPADSHLPLVFMLVLTQLSVGASVAAMVVEPTKWLALVSVTAGAFALGLASLHLGKPLKAWRAFLGWRKSWFSREVIVFAGYLPLAVAHVATFWLPPLAAFQNTLAVATAATGLLGVVCSAMIYVDTRREFWSAARTFGKFLGTTVLLGAAAAFAICHLTSSASPQVLTVTAAFLFIVTLTKLAFEHRIFRHLVDEEALVLTPLNKSARLFESQLGLVARARVACAVLGGLLLPPLLLLNGGGLALATLALCIVGECLERVFVFHRGRAEDHARRCGRMRAGRENSLLRQWHGPLTAELTLRPGDFGLGKVPARFKPDAITRSICGFCSTGCSLDIHLKDGLAVNLTPTNDHPVNLGMACPKGWEALSCLSAADRATAPLLRQPDGSMKTTTWDVAMRTFVARFKDLMAEHGPESVAFLSTGQICTEEMALLGCLWKFGMGALHCDSNTRQCMAAAHVAYKQSFGFDAPPFTYADFEESDVLVFVGANPCIAHPIMWQRVLRNKNNPQIIVVDPRRTETAASATQHLALKPKSDLTLLYGIANVLVQNNWLDRAFIENHTTGYSDFASFVRQFVPHKVAAETGLTVGQICQFAELIHRGKAVSFWWTMGVNQSHEATRTAQAIINLALMTGNIGRPGTGANSITGQCNAMGSRLYANITSLIGGRDFLKQEHRAQVAEVLDIPVERIPDRNSWAYDQIVQGIADGKIKGLWVIATNSSHSWIDQNNFNSLAGTLDFLVVQEMFATTDTARHADLILPAAGWGEKEGTFINSERRLGLVKKVSRAPGEALSDFSIFRLVAHYWGCDEMFREWSSPEAAFQLLKKLSGGQPCDITGIADYEHLDAEGGIQWPWSQENHQLSGAFIAENRQPATGNWQPPQARRLFADGQFFTPDGRARFIFDLPRPLAEPTDEEFPCILLTGRGTSAQWHTNTRTGKSAVLRTLYPANPYIEVHPADAGRLGLTANAPVAVVSRRARVVCAAFITATVQPGQVFIPMHYGVTNQLTRAEFDPHSRQPNYKHCAVRLEKMP